MTAPARSYQNLTHPTTSTYVHYVRGGPMLEPNHLGRVLT